jgi:hypothetical protein
MGKKQRTNSKNYKRKPIPNQMIYKIQRIQQPKLFNFLLKLYSRFSWIKHKTTSDAGNVTGLVVGDCRGDNSSNAYRAQMNQSRKGFMSEPLVSQT